MKDFHKRHPQAVERSLLAFVAFLGCFAFPIQSVNFPVDALKLYTLLAGYGSVAVGFAAVHGKKRLGRVYCMTLSFTILGLLCRYALEFGEVSNTYNFTPVNIVSYLALIPAGTMLSYWAAAAKLEEKNEHSKGDGGGH